MTEIGSATSLSLIKVSECEKPPSNVGLAIASVSVTLLVTVKAALGRCLALAPYSGIAGALPLGLEVPESVFSALGTILPKNILAAGRQAQIMLTWISATDHSAT